MRMITIKKNHLHASLLLKTPYGNELIDEPVLVALIQSPSVQRLKNINQYGIASYATNIPSFSRYDHSVGVMMLLRKYGCSLQEQIAGLLHDVSHTVFSHVADVLFDHTSEKNSYQDDIHEWYINKTELPEILSNFGFCVDDILHKQKKFTALEQDLPHICADRLEYNLRGALVEKKLSLQEIKKILDALILRDGCWIFCDKKIAREFAEISLYLQEYIYTSPISCLLSVWLAQLLKHAVKKNIITFDELHFSYDEKILKKVKQSKDTEVGRLLKQIMQTKKCNKQESKNYNSDFHVQVKFRGINPWVQENNNIYYLTELDEMFAKKYTAIKDKMKSGWYITL